MATIKELQTRIALKYDSYSNWIDESKENLGANLVLLKGEIGICEIPSGNTNATTAPTVLFKVGDGITPFKGLKWASALAADVYTWAKASDVTYDSTNKTITFVGGAVDAEGNKVNKVFTFNYVTLAEVEAITNVIEQDLSDLADRVTDTETDIADITKATDGIIDTRIAAAEGRAATDAQNKANAAESAAKTYADGLNTAMDTRVGALETASGEHAEAISDHADAIDGINDAIDAINNETSGILATAKGYTDSLVGDVTDGETVMSIIADIRASAYNDTEVRNLISGNTTQIGINAQAIAQEKSDREAAVSGETSAREAAINGINTKIGAVTDGKDVVTMISDAEAAAKSHAESKVSELATGAVATNTGDIAKNKQDIATLRADLTTETGAREALDARVVTIENFFEGAYSEDGKPLTDALDTLEEIQDYIDSHGEAAAKMVEDIQANATAIDTKIGENGTITKAVAANTQAISDMDTAYKAADTKVREDFAAADKVITDAIGTAADGADVATVYGAIAKAKADAISEANGEVTELGKTVAANTEAIGKNAQDISDVDGRVDTLASITKSYLTGGEDAIKKAIDAVSERAEKGITDAKSAQDAADAAQGDVDDLATIVGDAESGLVQLVNSVKVTADTAAQNLAELTGDTGRIKAVEGEVDDIQAIVYKTVDGTTTNIRDDVTSLQTLTGDASKGNVALYNEITRVAGLVENADTGLAKVKEIADGAASLANTNAGDIADIKADYLKAADEYIFRCGTASTVVHNV